ncbi:MAG TPA: hypothetical protein VM938_03315 [Acidimicrobiales bacterium]|nr:hypothetical protein [Acidimicrobiales bacterium]
MFPTVDEDDMLQALRSERPAVSAERCAPDPAVLDAIVATPRYRRRRPLAVAAAAAVLAGAVLAGQLDVGKDGVKVSGPPPVAADIARIASTSSAALTSSGRALVDFHMAQGTMAEQRLTGTVSFAGDDVEMVLTFAPDGRGPGFEARNRTVDGQFYLYDAGRWVRDTNATGTQGRDLFSADPRTLLGALHAGAGFEVVGTETVDGVELRHLRATRVDQLPTLNLSMGPMDPKEVRSLEVWVGADDVVRRLDIGTVQLSTTSTEPPPTVVVRDADGKSRVKMGPVPADWPGAVTKEVRSTYSLRFTDIGAAITITAPKGAVDVAGQG